MKDLLKARERTREISWSSIFICFYMFSYFDQPIKQLIDFFFFFFFVPETEYIGFTGHSIKKVQRALLRDSAWELVLRIQCFFLFLQHSGVKSARQPPIFSSKIRQSIAQ